ncbi:hypothetical protein [Streptomyces melanogenes]
MSGARASVDAYETFRESVLAFVSAVRTVVHDLGPTAAAARLRAR